MQNGKSKLVLILGMAIVLVILCPVVIVLMNRPTPPSVRLPSPNAYETLSRAGKIVIGLPADLAETEDISKLKRFVVENDEALMLIQQAADQESVVPINYEGTMSEVVGDNSIRQAMRLLQAQARIAELEKDVAGAAQLYANIFLLSGKSAQGGFMVHVLVAAAHERIALHKLKELAGDLTAQQKLEVRELLEKVNRQPRNIDEMIEREHVLVKKEHGTLRGMWMIRATEALAQPAIQQTTKVDAEVVQKYQEVLNLLGE